MCVCVSVYENRKHQPIEGGEKIQKFNWSIKLNEELYFVIIHTLKLVNNWIRKREKNCQNDTNTNLLSSNETQLKSSSQKKS